jgi:general nucleoside transport system ATP-binding protein
MTAAIELIGITKRFPGVVANDNVNLTVEPGEIHAISARTAPASRPS